MFIAACLLVVYLGQRPPVVLNLSQVPPQILHLFHVSRQVTLFGHMPPLVVQTIYVLLIANCFIFIGAPIVAAMTGWEEAKLVSFFSVLASTAVLVQVPFLRFGYLVALIVAQAFGTLVPFYFQIKWGRRFTSLRPTFDPRLWLRLIRGGIPFLANSLTLQIYSASSIYILGFFTSAGMVGTYATAVRLVGISSYIPTAIYMAMLPSAVRMASLGGDELDQVQARTFKYIVICGFWCTAIVFLLGPPAAALIYIKRYPDIMLIMQAGAFTIIPLFIVTTLYSFLVARGRNGIWSYFLLGTTLLNVLLCLILIPWTRDHLHNGAAGAVFAVAIAETVTMVAAIALLKLKVFTGDTVSYGLKTVAATALMAGATALMLRFCHGLLIVIPGVV
jgi:O-antigen/teichoic acid export membrane protein